MLGEKRLKEIQQRLTGVLKDVAPKNAGKYEIQYKPMERYFHDVIGTVVSIGMRDAPAYELYLVSKEDPAKSYKIMHVTWPDIREKTPPIMEKYYGGSAFADKVKKGVEELEKARSKMRGKPSRLETLGIISILGIFAGIFFLSTNVTGNAIADLTDKTSSIIGGGLLVAGLVAGFLWIKSRKR